MTGKTALPEDERVPELAEPWLTWWKETLALLKAEELWRPHLRPLLDCYVGAMKRSHDLRVVLENPRCSAAKRDQALINADREERRAMRLAEALGLIGTAALRARHRAATADAGAADPFKELDELAPRRRRRQEPTA